MSTDETPDDDPGESDETDGEVAEDDLGESDVRERIEQEADRAVEQFDEGIVDLLAWVLDTETRARIYVHLRQRPHSTSEEIADIAQFLASPASSYMVGETLTARGVPDIMESTPET